jgi:hypothetical protein
MSLQSGWKIAEDRATDSLVLIGKIAIGRTTIDVLRINDADCVEQREELMDAGLFPPEA